MPGATYWPKTQIQDRGHKSLRLTISPDIVKDLKLKPRQTIKVTIEVAE